jgi:uncharacterized protein (TIGR03437 family)
VNATAFDSAGNVLLAGTAPPGLPTTDGALQPSGTDSAAAPFVLKLNNVGTAVLWGTYFGGSQGGAVQGLHLDPQGQILFTGYLRAALGPPSDFPYTFVARLTGGGAKLVDFYKGPLSYFVTGASLTTTPTGGFASLSQSGAIWIETAPAGPSLLNVADSASGLYSSTVAPQELISLYGLGIGPQSPVNGQIEERKFTASLAGYEVLFDGIPAPLTYADSGQINTVVPRAAASSTHIKIVTPAGTIDGPTLRVGTRPALFQDIGTGFAIAANADGSLNSYSHPAKPGSTVTVYATGVGPGNEFFADGTIVPLAIYDWIQPVWL